MVIAPNSTSISQDAEASHMLQCGAHTLYALEYNAHLRGQHTPIIFIHGIGASHRQWATYQAEALHDKHWLALTLPLHYPAKTTSSLPKRAEDVVAMVQDITSHAVAQLLAAVDAEEVILVGHSTGGFASLLIAEKLPQRIKAMLILDGFYHGHWGMPLRSGQLTARLPFIGKALFVAYGHVLVATKGIFKMAFDLLAIQRQAMRQHPAYDAMRHVSLETGRKASKDGTYPYYRHMPDINILPRLANIHTPTHIVHGTVDSIIAPQQAHDMHTTLPNATLTWLESGHMPFLETGDAYEKALLAWLDEVV
jgi:pimeloyl-ACP methyl ester carboxylesterase